MSEAAAEPTAPPAPEPEPKEQAATDYVILGQIEEPQKDDAEPKPPTKWYVLATVSARSAKAAVREWLDKRAEKPDGTYVAVPARSWQPITVKTETQTKITLS